MRLAFYKLRRRIGVPLFIALGVLVAVPLPAAVAVGQPALAEDAVQHAADLARAKAHGGISPDRVVVIYRLTAPPPTSGNRAGAQLLRTEGRGGRELLRAPSGNADAIAQLLRQHPDVLDAYPDRVVHKSAATNDPLLADQWGLATIHATTAWNVTQGAGVKVAVLDCGIHASHPDLTGQVVLEQNWTSTLTADDGCNHGTHVAGTIAALANNGVGGAGVAPGAQLLNGKVLDDSGAGYMFDVAAGMEWAADNGARVINMSLGAQLPCDAATQQAVNYAWNKGVVLVAAAGNSGTSGAATPANCQHVIGVAATDQNDAAASFSNYGAKVEVAAPGDIILSTVNSNLAENSGSAYAWFSGTSMAAPHVAGVAALIWASSFGTSATAVRDRLFSTASQIPGTGTQWTYGRVDAAAAVAGVIAPVTPLPGFVQSFAQPQRLIDTRTSGGPIPSGSARCFSVAGQAGIPANATGVVLNITAAEYQKPGWLSVYPAGQPAPTTSTLNFDVSEYATANSSIMRLGSSGQVCVTVGTINSAVGGSQVILDATGYLTSGAPSQLPLLSAPQRLVDTRLSGGPIATGSTRCFTIAGQGSVPADAAGVVLNATAVGYSTIGWLTVFPNGQPVPATSTVNFDPAVYAMANGAFVKLGTGGQLCVNVGTVNAVPGSAHVVLDVTGYLTASGVLQLPLMSSPPRVADTRTSGGPIAAGTSRCFTVAGQAGVPADAGGVILNITAVGYSAKGWITIYPSGQAVPATSTLNFDPSEYAMANSTIVRLGAGGAVCAYVGTVGSVWGPSHVLVDVVGYIAP